ncbi:DUF397 domain-containing protein [Streptomyces qinglanensis]|uniref:DUF397 domain-containing protein n=1 Tax=Streptomyces qinglanensis TaxID=943816 RepID=UPI003D740C64
MKRFDRDWFESFCGNGTQNCVEVRVSACLDTCGSKVQDSPVLTFGAEQWAAFVAGVADGRLGR